MLRRLKLEKYIERKDSGEENEDSSENSGSGSEISFRFSNQNDENRSYNCDMFEKKAIELEPLN
jgi:hypothetical protein